MLAEVGGRGAAESRMYNLKAAPHLETMTIPTPKWFQHKTLSVSQNPAFVH